MVVTFPNLTCTQVQLCDSHAVGFLRSPLGLRVMTRFFPTTSLSHTVMTSAWMPSSSRTHRPYGVDLTPFLGHRDTCEDLILRPLPFFGFLLACQATGRVWVLQYQLLKERSLGVKRTLLPEALTSRVVSLDLQSKLTWHTPLHARLVLWMRHKHQSCWSVSVADWRHDTWTWLGQECLSPYLELSMVRHKMTTPSFIEAGTDHMLFSLCVQEGVLGNEQKEGDGQLERSDAQAWAAVPGLVCLVCKERDIVLDIAWTRSYLPWPRGPTIPVHFPDDPGSILVPGYGVNRGMVMVQRVTYRTSPTWLTQLQRYRTPSHELQLRGIEDIIQVLPMPGSQSLLLLCRSYGQVRPDSCHAVLLHSDRGLIGRVLNLSTRHVKAACPALVRGEKGLFLALLSKNHVLIPPIRRLWRSQLGSPSSTDLVKMMYTVPDQPTVEIERREVESAAKEKKEEEGKDNCSVEVSCAVERVITATESERKGQQMKTSFCIPDVPLQEEMGCMDDVVLIQQDLLSDLLFLPVHKKRHNAQAHLGSKVRSLRRFRAWTTARASSKAHGEHIRMKRMSHHTLSGKRQRLCHIVMH